MQKYVLTQANKDCDFENRLHLVENSGNTTNIENTNTFHEHQNKGYAYFPRKDSNVVTGPILLAHAGA